MQNTKQNNREEELGVFWKRESKPKTPDQKPMNYLVGTINLKSLGFDKDVPLVVFTNKYKETDNQPDLRIYLSKPKVASTTVTNNTVSSRLPSPKSNAPVVAVSEQNEETDTIL